MVQRLMISMRSLNLFVFLGATACTTLSQNSEKESQVMETPQFVQYSDKLGRDILYKPTRRVQDIQAKTVQSLIDSMHPKMTAAGIGLAANQVGEPLQLFMIEYHPPTEDTKESTRYKVIMPDVPYQVFINPRITKASKETVSFWHGCLSAADKERGKVATYKWIEYQAYNRDGKKIMGRLDDLGAVIFQHEFRHLLGKLYFDQTHIFMASEELDRKRQSGEIKAYEICGKEVPLLLADYDVGESIEDYARRLSKSQD